MPAEDKEKFICLLAGKGTLSYFNETVLAFLMILHLPTHGLNYLNCLHDDQHAETWIKTSSLPTLASLRMDAQRVCTKKGIPKCGRMLNTRNIL